MKPMQHGSAAKKAVKKRHAFIMRRSVNTLAHSRSLNSWPDFPWIEQKEMYRQNDPVPDDALTNGSPNSKVEERGDPFFWLHAFRIMHVMRNLGKWKMPISRIFGVPASAGSFSGLVQPFCTFCNFYHILWFYLSHAYRCFLCYALLHRFVCNSFIPVSI